MNKADAISGTVLSGHRCFGRTTAIRTIHIEPRHWTKFKHAQSATFVAEGGIANLQESATRTPLRAVTHGY